MDPIDKYAELLAAEDAAIVAIRRLVVEGKPLAPGMAQLETACRARLDFAAAQGWNEDAEFNAAVDAHDRNDAEPEAEPDHGCGCGHPDCGAC